MTGHPGSNDGKKFDFETAEHWTGRNWIDGKPIFRKVIDTGALPNNALQNTAHGIAGLDHVVSLQGLAAGAGSTTPMPNGTTVNSFQVELTIDGTNVIITTGTDFSAFTGTVIVEYTKT